MRGASIPREICMLLQGFRLRVLEIVTIFRAGFCPPSPRPSPPGVPGRGGRSLADSAAPGRVLEREARHAFTLIEVLVVIAIIAILVALTAAAVFQVIASQRRTNTENTMKGVYKELEKQIKAVLLKADEETIPPYVINFLAGGDQHRARLIWKKLRLKQEFPMTFAEARNPYLTYANATCPGWTTGPTDLPPLPAYVNALKNIPPANQPWQLYKPWEFLESSICLVLALHQHRGGVVASTDVLGTAAMDINGSGLKALVDNWGYPIAFFRFPTSNDAPTVGVMQGNSALDARNPTAQGVNAKYRDPLDSEGLLLTPNWNNYDNFSSQSGVYWFEQLCHVVHSPNSGLQPLAVPPNYVGSATSTNYASWPRYMVPTLVSAGPDGKWGFNCPFNQNSNSSYATVGVNPDMSLNPGPHSPTDASPIAPDSNDNIYVPSLNPTGG